MSRERTFTEAEKDYILKMASVGITRDQIAKVFSCSEKTLRRKFKNEIDAAAIKAVASVAGALYKTAMKGNVAAQIFFLKTRGGWSEKNQGLDADDGIEKIRIVFQSKPAITERPS